MPTKEQFKTKTKYKKSFAPIPNGFRFFCNRFQFVRPEFILPICPRRNLSSEIYFSYLSAPNLSAMAIAVLIPSTAALIIPPA